jgi:hypothetical protein
MPGKKGKASKNADEPYDGFSAPVALLQTRFKQNATQSGIAAAVMAPVLDMFEKVLQEEGGDKSLKQVATLLSRSLPSSLNPSFLCIDCNCSANWWPMRRTALQDLSGALLLEAEIYLPLER